MKRLFVLVGMLCTLVVAYPAAADYENNRRDQRYERSERDARRYERGGGESRDAGRGRGIQREQRSERLSPDQRRQLRRDIEDLGRDVYRERGRRGRE